MDACTNPDILRVIWFFLMLIDIVKIIIPIALIVLGIIDFSKAAITSDEKVQQKTGKLFAKRLLYAVLVFTIPWLVEVLMVTLGNIMGKEGVVNFTDCIENANSESIEKLESGTFYHKCYVCSIDKTKYYFGEKPSWTYRDCGGAGWFETDLTEEDCGVKKCHMCTATGARYWGVYTSNSGINCPNSWVSTTETEENCK